MTIEEILKTDLKNNYAGTDLDLAGAANILEYYIQNGAAFKRAGNTLFIVYDYEGDVVKYHTINGDPLKQFLENCVYFFAYLYKMGKSKAITYFSDPKTKRIVEKYKLSNETIQPSDDPEQGEFMLITDLRGGA